MCASATATRQRATNSEDVAIHHAYFTAFRLPGRLCAINNSCCAAPHCDATPPTRSSTHFAAAAQYSPCMMHLPCCVCVSKPLQCTAAYTPGPQPRRLFDPLHRTKLLIRPSAASSDPGPVPQPQPRCALPPYRRRLILLLPWPLTRTIPCCSPTSSYPDAVLDSAALPENFCIIESPESVKARHRSMLAAAGHVLCVAARLHAAARRRGPSGAATIASIGVATAIHRRAPLLHPCTCYGVLRCAGLCSAAA